MQEWDLNFAMRIKSCYVRKILAPTLTHDSQRHLRPLLAIWPPPETSATAPQPTCLDYSSISATDDGTVQATRSDQHPRDPGQKIGLSEQSFKDVPDAGFISGGIFRRTCHF